VFGLDNKIFFYQACIICFKTDRTKKDRKKKEREDKALPNIG
jgi:hypothetical protein